MTILHGDCLQHMLKLKSHDFQADAIITDPPYGLKMMGNQWDAPGNVAFRPDTWKLALDLLPPGGMLAAFGAPKTYHRMACAIEDGGFEIRDCVMWLFGNGFPKNQNLLKPAYEPIILARKPGALRRLNIDECRIEVAEGDVRSGGFDQGHGFWVKGERGNTVTVGAELGRYPANVVHDGSDDVLDAFAVHGERKTSGQKTAGARRYNGMFGDIPDGHHYGDTGTAARFYYCSKVRGAERLSHPTQKPLSLMQWIVRLITPSDGMVLDPFAGTGTTVVAALNEGRRAIGIESDPLYYVEALNRFQSHAVAAE